MQRTQISLTDDVRRLLDDEAARSGRSISALIRDAVARTYGGVRSVHDDLRALDASFGSWHGTDHDDGAAYVERLRSGRRIER